MTPKADSSAQEIPTIVGRSSSHFTRLTRILAAELAVPYSFRVVPDLLEVHQTAYSGNPSLKIPILLLDGQNYFGSLNICRRLSERSPHVKVEWPENLQLAEDQNACEVVLQAMSTEVSQIMAERGGVNESSSYCVKLNESLSGSVDWLEHYVGEHSPAKSRFDLRILDVMVFCLVSHLVFRETIDLAEFPSLRAFTDSFSSRQSAQTTAYRYD